MNTDPTARPAGPSTDPIVPDMLAQWVIKTARSQEMIAWYRTVFGATVVREDRQIAFLSWDTESNRLALVKVPGLLRYLFPLAKLRRKIYGIDLLALTFATLAATTADFFDRSDWKTL